jgi:hypothetical protein
MIVEANIMGTGETIAIIVNIIPIIMVIVNAIHDHVVWKRELDEFTYGEEIASTFAEVLAEADEGNDG